jgi:aminoglycoside/choline kinase family phosphotransferase
MSVNNPDLTTISWADTARQQLFNSWLSSCIQEFSLDPSTLTLASADASFRRYFRLLGSDATKTSFIIMDAPPDKENCDSFVSIAALFHKAGLLVPQILSWNRVDGFLLLSDLGTLTLLQQLGTELDLCSTHVTPPLKPFIKALDALLLLQQASTPDVLPLYDEALLYKELCLFPDWYLSKHKGISLTTEQQNILDSSFKTIIQSNLSAPSVFVHRDFMTRNLMVPTSPHEERLGVLDFQDAVMGPITYDIASLMRDAFCSWSEEFVLDITIRYWERIRTSGLIDANGWSEDFGEFWRAVEWMGLQRHLKVAGIFARLTIRDNKPKYLADAPRFLNYIRSTAQRYRELFPLIRMLDKIENTQSNQAFSFGRL